MTQPNEHSHHPHGHGGHHDHGPAPAAGAQTLPSPAAAPVVEVDIRNAYNGSEYADLEGHFRSLPGVTGVHLDRTRGVAHLSYNPAETTAERLGERLARDGYRGGDAPD